MRKFKFKVSSEVWEDIKKSFNEEGKKKKKHVSLHEFLSEINSLLFILSFFPLPL